MHNGHLAALKGEEIPANATGARLAALQAARDAIAAIQQRLDATRLTAPIDGVVTRVSITVGEYAAQAQPLFSSAMWRISRSRPPI